MFLSSNMMNIKLLLIEDDEDDYVLTRDLLDEIAKGQYSLEWAPNAALARDALQRNEHDVCLLDYRLGQDDGLILLEEAPRLGFSAPIIMLTGQDDTALDLNALRAGAVDYLVKSQLNGARLARAIRYAVARREVETERLERLRAEAESRSKSEFLAHLSHELRTPLTAILGYTDILLHRQNEGKDQADLLTIKRNGQHLLSLLNDVLDLSKIAAGKLEINRQRVDLNSFLTDLRSLMEVAAREKNLSLRFSADRPLPTHIETDPIRLRQILINLIGNGIKFTEHGSVHIKVLAPHRDLSQIRFEVRDTGVGIDPEYLGKLFQPFSQGDEGRLLANEGSGLGLTISKQLAARLGGDIQVSSEAGQGSTFTLSVDAGPLSDVSFAPLAMYRKAGTDLKPEQIRISGRVLVVDDLPDIRRLVGEMIFNAGADVTCASDGDEAVDHYHHACTRGEPFDLIIMDMQMPGMDGLAASTQLRRDGCQCPILALTAATMQGEKERCITAGCDDYLSKPVEESALLSAARTLLAARVPPEEDEPEPGTTRKNLVLLVEDNADVRRATREILDLLGWEVLEADCAAQALRVAEGQTPFLALVDLSLPDMSGYQLVEELRREGHSATRFITLSGYSGDVEREQKAGISRHLTKPLGLSELEQALSAIT
ncbi:response regulator [Gilvimarinus sp. F26214L]|uniref:response regulator n=1 Tax=Gilvimarinus sp. DZF01 TaxID=3461371 RepID=UPI0040454DBC